MNYCEKIIILALVLVGITFSCEDNDYLVISKKEIVDKETRLLFEKIDDSLFVFWKNGKYIDEELGLCGCLPNGFSIESNHDVGDSLWAFDWCGSPDSIVTILSKENVYEGPLHFSLSRSSKLFKMVEQLKAAIMKDRVKFFLKK